MGITHRLWVVHYVSRGQSTGPTRQQCKLGHDHLQQQQQNPVRPTCYPSSANIPTNEAPTSLARSSVQSLRGGGPRGRSNCIDPHQKDGETQPEMESEQKLGDTTQYQPQPRYTQP
jgi:hypothetical protein